VRRSEDRSATPEAAPSSRVRPRRRGYETTADRPVLARARRRVTMADVDAARILYFAAPFRWVEELYTSWLAELGHPVSEMLRERMSTPAVSSRCDYEHPLRLDDRFTIALRAGRVGTSSFSVVGEVTLEPSRVHCVRVEVVHVWAAFDERREATRLDVSPLPRWLRHALGSPAPQHA
jgi:YbgC/YbaW family acyl-CoA thioester hydrolase